MNHTDFGNGVLSIWKDRSRWEGLLAAQATGDEDLWKEGSRRVWRSSFERWKKVSVAIRRCTLSAEKRFRATAPLKSVFGSSRWLELVDHYATASLHKRIRLREWTKSVLEGVEDVAVAVERIPESVRGREAERDGIGSDYDPERLREALEALARSGSRLKEIFSGRGYFVDHGSE